MSLTRVIVISLTTGILTAAGLTIGALPGAAESTIIGAGLLGFAAGWALLAALPAGRSQRWAFVPAGRPQRWAAVPAVVLTATGLALLITAPGPDPLTTLGWVWPPALLVLTAWMIVQTRRSVPRRPARWLYPVLAAMVLAAAGGAVQTVAGGRGAMPGSRYDVGGYRLHLACSGTGGPAVVLIGGVGEASPVWSRVARAVATTSRVCAYDRAGQQWSDDSGNPADSDHTVADLHALLHAAGVPGPYVLAGHSSGGVFALAFAARHPAEVAGMVLLDSSSPDQGAAQPGFAREYRIFRHALAVVPTLARLVPGGITARIMPGAGPRGLRNLRAEQAALPDAFRQAQALTSLDHRPLIVLTARDTAESTAGWAAAQDRLAALSTDHRHQTLDLGHTALLGDPAGAAASARAVTDVVAAVRTRSDVR